MAESWKARQMVPGRDTLGTMAVHYGITPATVRDIIKSAGVEVIRAVDGHRGRLVNLTSAMVSTSSKQVISKVRSVVWDDAQPFDPDGTKLTQPAIMAVANWKLRQNENGSDSES